MAGKFFTLEEANSLVPELEDAFSRIFELNDILKRMNIGVKDLFDIWGNELLDSRNPDNFLYMERLQKRDGLMSAIKNEVAQIQAMGIEVKDLKNGLVDFLHDNGGEVVFLCWRHGEKQVQYWHPIESGFANRRRIEELGGMKYLERS